MNGKRVEYSGDTGGKMGVGGGYFTEKSDDSEKVILVVFR